MNVVDNGTVAQIIAGYAGQVAVMGSGSFPSDAVNSPVIVGSQMIGALTDLSIATGDATLTGSGTLTIPAGAGAASIDVIVVGDLDPEVTEKARITLSDASGTTIARSTGTLIIQNGN